MGVPKFFRWMSERYPAISQLIAENRIPEFDCLYLDMNGIIHNCTHKDSDDATFRMTEEQMFMAIFNYIEHLFGKIKPKQLFFMAIDGVAPRAKMNQQRARRFRTALDVENARNKAIAEGKELPKEEAFDSNAITPGTEFMHKLTQQLKYFINKKVSEDIDWQGPEIVLSGHEVPGEGEHKIMEYIRLAKAQHEYDPNVRHCLYGLDADLIMLGLLSHDPHFCLLREEVTFGRQAKTKSKELEHQNFYLMHLCIVREYLALEFQQLKEPGVLNFSFDLERVIDDFILMAFFVGNDFLPNLPNLHINEGALALMFKIYKTVLPKSGGYINEGGVINMQRLAILLEELSDVEYRFFESESSDERWFKGKQMAREDIMDKGKTKGKIVMTTAQKLIWKEVKVYITTRLQAPLNLSSTLPATDRKFAQELAENLHLNWRTVENDDGIRHMQLSFPAKQGSDDDGDEDEESQLAILRVLKQYDNAPVLDVSKEDAKAAMDKQYEEKFQEWKNRYYEGKFDWDRNNDVELTKLCENYVQGLQWVLYYYYRGVVSWPWYYQFHYSPMISDVTKGLKANVDFRLGQPFHPYEQLMGVLPDRSRKIVPKVYHDLMTDPSSPIIDFYPRDFDLDMNGKKMEWEAVVKIPFIDERRLLSAMASKNKLLTDAETARNEFGVTLKFTHDPDVDFIYPSSLVGVFNDIGHCHCVENIFDLPTIEGLDYHVGLMEGVKLGDAALAGFPSLSNLPYNAAHGFHGVNVFQQESRNESIVVTLEDTDFRTSTKSALAKLGQRVFVAYPFLQEGKVIKVSDGLFDYFPSEDGSAYPIQRNHQPREADDWRKKAERIENSYSRRLGILIGPVESITHVEILKGLRKTDEGAMVKEYGLVPSIETDYASQVIVNSVLSEDQRFLEKEALTIEEEFPIGSKAFFLEESQYGRPAIIHDHADNRAEIQVSMLTGKEIDIGKSVLYNSASQIRYTPSYRVAESLGLNGLILSKITSSFTVTTVGQMRLNLGLNLKFESKKLKVLGYSRRNEKGWEFSDKAITLISQYMIKFPEFFAGLSRNPRADSYDETDFYDSSVSSSKIKEMVAWLKHVEAKEFEKVPLDAEQLDSDTVMALESAAAAVLANEASPQLKKFKGVPMKALMKPSDAEHRLGNQRFTLGDRVVYVQDSGRVPIAARGFVVGISHMSRTVLLDVLFDNAFMSGTNLGDRCTMFRGGTVPASSLLNLSNKQVVVMSRVSAEKRPVSQQTPLTVNGAGASRGAYGVPGGKQFTEAATPPPLRGSYRKAMVEGLNSMAGRGRGGTSLPFHPHNPNGIHDGVRGGRSGRGGRGRGGPGQEGLKWIANETGPFRGRRGGQQPHYHAVPPPGNLEVRGVRGIRGGRSFNRGWRSGIDRRGRGAASDVGGPPTQLQNQL